ncbi:hypothetical protein BAC1_01288 [uncultured bacterium]|nr:hypothetical protein BAC1_01288 [uncultured bacterium]
MKRKSLLILSALILAAAAAPDEARSEGKGYDSSCGSGSWFRGNCWNLGTVPVDGDFVYLPAADAGLTVTYDANSSIRLEGLSIAYPEGGSTTLRITAPGARIETGDITLGDTASMRSGASGSIVQEGGTVTASVVTRSWDGALTSGALEMGRSSLDRGSYTLTGGGLYTVSTIVGNKGTGTFTHDGATGSDVVHEASQLIVGSFAGSSGVYNLGAGRLTSNSQIVGSGGTGEFIQSAPLNSYNSTGSLTVGLDATGVGTYTMQGGWLFADSEIIGGSGTGTFTHWGGLNDVTGDLIIGRYGGSNGSYAMNGMFSGNPELRANNEYVGNYGTGSFEQYGGTNTVAGGLHIGMKPARSGTYVLDGWGTLSAAEITVAEYGTDTFFTQHSGSVTANTLVIGKNAGSSGTYNMNMGNLTAANITVGHDGDGVFNQADGQNMYFEGGSLSVGSGSGSGTYNMSGGMLATTNINIGTGSGTGTFNHAGANVSAQGTITIGPNGQYNMSDDGSSWFGPRLYADRIINNGTINFAGGTIETSGGICSYCGEGPAPTNVENNGTINFSGPGQRYMSGNIVNNGTMKITDTTVVFNKDFLNNGAYLSDPSSNYFSNLTVGSSGYLVGGVGDNFFINDDFFNYSDQTGLWDTTDAYLGFIGWNAHEFRLGGWDEASNMAFAWDTLELSEYGNLFLSGGLGAALYVDNLILGAGSTLDLSGFNIYYSSFTDLGGSFYGGQLIHLASGTEAGPAPVPEPSTMLLLGSGIAGLIGARRLKRRRH